ncbi:carbohydrate ABC transporter membrane protein 1 (CUT1 family) [Cohnella lupini]|uniref:Carbohydrate ABC transporter membrane protein 1 (CUT1 family) n=1 Tax=Cohnella lupini TaxID=1294267 RepID=A0A3D9I0N5_9BACL|nr:carbohydrate ABC transporter membrane protein 1 (CUT1 family) [Cohnella lupini]
MYSYRLVIPALVMYGLVFIYPTITGFYYSFTDWSPINGILKFSGLDNFKYIFNNDALLLAIRNTIVYAAICIVLKNVFGLLLAVALNTAIRSRNWLRAVFFAPSIVSSIVIGLVFIPILQPEGLLNEFASFIGLGALRQYWLSDTSIVIFTIAAVSIWQWTGYHMAIYLAGLQSISNDFYEASTIDGANAWQRFRFMTIPLLSASININVMLSLVGGLRVFGEVYSLTNGGPGNASQVLSTSVFVLFGEGRWGLGTALNTLLFLIVSVAAIPLLRKMRKQEVEA